MEEEKKERINKIEEVSEEILQKTKFYAELINSARIGTDNYKFDFS